MPARKWVREGDGVYVCYELLPVARITRDDPPNNSHISIWDVRIGDRHFTNQPTLRDAKRVAERRLDNTEEEDE